MRGGRRGGGRQRRYDEDELQGAVGGEYDEQNYEATPIFRNAPSINTNCIEEFPTLSGEAPPPKLGPPNRQNSRKVAVNNGGVTIRTVRQSQPLAITDENFPALGPDNTAGSCKTVRLSVNSGTQDRPNSGANGSMRGGSQKPPTNVSIHVNHRSSGSSQNIRIRPASSMPSQFHDDFPSLSSSKAPTSNSSVQWLGNQGGSGTKTKIQAPSSQSQPPKAFKPEEDFPSLSSKFSTGCSVASSSTSSSAKGDTRSKKASSVMIPVTSSWTMSQSSSRTHESSSEPGVSGKLCDEVLSNTTSSLGNIKVKSKKKKTKSASSHNTNTGSSGNDFGSATKPTTKDLNANESGKKKKKQGNAECEGQQKSQPEPQNKKNGVEDRENENPADSTPTHERKRSELVIASLAPQQPIENNNNDEKENSSGTNSWSLEERFPLFTTEIVDSIVGSSSLPPGFDKPKNRGKLTSGPPPGFGGSATTTAPPPGFLVTLNSVARPQSNGLTFTSSSGQSYSIPQGRTGNSSHSFIQQPDFKRRNKELDTRIKELLHDSHSVSNIRLNSKLFQQGEMSANEFYARCRETLGPKSFQEIFAELLVLLPNIEKQQVR